MRTLTLTLRTPIQAVLFQNELKGQFSDGHWENATPRDHWAPWCSAVIRVAAAFEPVGRNFHVRREAYALASKDLLDAVGARMVGYARIAQRFGREVAELFQHRISTEGTLDLRYLSPEAVQTLHENMARLGVTTVGIIDCLANSGYYNIRNLRRDLREIAAAMKIDVRSLPTQTPIADAVRAALTRGDLDAMRQANAVQAALANIPRGDDFDTAAF